MNPEEKEEVIDRRAFLRIMSRPSQLFSVAMNQKFWNITVVTCSCKGKTSIRMSDLEIFLKKLGVKEILQHDELCGPDGERCFASAMRKRPNSILVAACTKQLIFRDIAAHLDYPVKDLHILELQELCGWVHEDPEAASEKAKRMMSAALARISSSELRDQTIGHMALATSKALEPGNIRSLYGMLDSCPAKDGVCLLCRDLCPRNAIAQSERGITVDRRLCSCCGICELVCPLELLKIIPRDNRSIELRQMLTASEDLIDLEKKETLGKQVVAFSCENQAKMSLARLGSSRMTYPESILPVFVRCLSDVSVSLVMQALNWGAQGVILIGCQDCYQDSQEYSNALADMFRVFSDESILNGRLEILRTDGTDSERLLESLEKIHDRISQKEKMKIEHSPKIYKGRRDELMDLLRNLQMHGAIKERIQQHKIVPLGHVYFETSDCNMCLHCADRCPTDALQIQERNLLFDHAKCIACGLCVNACERKAIRLSSEIRISRLGKDEIVRKGNREGSFS